MICRLRYLTKALQTVCGLFLSGKADIFNSIDEYANDVTDAHGWQVPPPQALAGWRCHPEKGYEKNSFNTRSTATLETLFRKPICLWRFNLLQLWYSPMVLLTRMPLPLLDRWLERLWCRIFVKLGLNEVISDLNTNDAGIMCLTGQADLGWYNPIKVLRGEFRRYWCGFKNDSYALHHGMVAALGTPSSQPTKESFKLMHACDKNADYFFVADPEVVGFRSSNWFGLYTGIPSSLYWQLKSFRRGRSRHDSSREAKPDQSSSRCLVYTEPREKLQQRSSGKSRHE